MSAVPAAPAVDFLGVANRTLADLAQRIGLPSWWIGRTEGTDQVILAATDPLFGLTPGDALPWADTHCRRVVEDGVDPVLAGLDSVPASLAPLAAGKDLGAVSLITVPLTGPDGTVLATLCGVGGGNGAHLHDLVPSVRLQGDLLGALLAAELELTERSRAAERSAQSERADEVTGVAPPETWQTALIAEEARAARHAAPVSIVLIDLPDLVDVNRRLGYAAGDGLLHRTASTVGARLRSGDLLARIAGDRFGVLLPGSGLEGSRAFVERIRTALAADGVSVRVGAATRDRAQGLLATWARAEDAIAADTASRASATPPPPARTVSGSDSTLDALLDLARRQIGAEFAFISTLEGDRRYIRNAVSPFPTSLTPGTEVTGRRSLCDRVLSQDDALVAVDTSEPEFDAHRDHLLREGSYVGIPLHRRDGSLYGTLCTVSRTPDHSLRPRDAEILRAVTGAVMELVEEEDRSRRARRGKLARLDDLDAAGGPVVVYQPVVDLATGQAVGVEALSRFPHGTPTPDRWFADATEVGCGEELELSALDNALHGLPVLPGFLALNLSPATITTPGLLRRLERLPLDRIVLEITEHSAVADYASLLSTLEPLRRRGLRIAVDDTGAGYASLSHVLAILPDFIKLDISLVRDIDTDTSRRALAAGLVTFASATDALIIAEGIETAEELDVLRELGVQLGQGYHLARPAALSASR